jgi:hypothetical protein
MWEIMNIGIKINCEEGALHCAVFDGCDNTESYSPWKSKIFSFE